MNVGGGTGDGAPVVGPAPTRTHPQGVESPRSVNPSTGKAARRPPQNPDPVEAVLDLLNHLTDHLDQPPTQETATIHSLEYERYVAAPRRQGRDPMWDAMWAEATAHLRDSTAEPA